MPGKKRLGPFRLPELRKVGPGDGRYNLVRRAKKYLRDVASGHVVVDDPDSEIRQSSRSPQTPHVDRSILGASTVDEDED